MRGFIIVAVLAAAAMTPAVVLAAERPLTKAQAEAKCRAELDTFDGDKRRSRTGYSLAQDMAFCVKQKTQAGK